MGNQDLCKIFSNDTKTLLELCKEDLDLLNKIPYAMCVLQKEKQLGIKWANSFFYALLNYTQEEIGYKFANKMESIINHNGIIVEETFNNNDDAQLVELQIQVITKDNTHKWLYVTGANVVCEKEECIYLILYDNSKYINLDLNFKEYLHTVKQLTKRTDYEAFRYNLDTKKAHVYVSHYIMNALDKEDQDTHGSFTAALIAKDLIHKDYVQGFKDAFELMHTLGKPFSKEIRMKHNSGEYIWVNLTVEIKEDVENGRHAVGIIRNIHSNKVAFFKYLTETHFFQAMLSEKTAYALADLNEDRISKTGGMWNLYNEIIDKVTYTNLVREFINKVVHVDDRAHYLDLMDKDKLIQSYKQGNSCVGCDFRRIVDQNKLAWMNITIHLLQDTHSGHIVMLAYLRNLDEGKKTELYATENHTDFDALVSEHGDMAYIINKDNFDLICGNIAFYNRVGLTKEECEGLKCYEILHKRTQPCPFCSKANWSTDKFYIWENHNEYLEQDFLIKNKLIYWQKKEVVLAISIDISNDKSIVDSMESLSEESHVILSGIQKMNDAKNLTELLEHALETIGCFFDAKNVLFWENINNEHIFDCTAVWSKNDANVLKNQRSITAGVVNEWISARKWNAPLVIESMEDMLALSYEMYEVMQLASVNNQRWVPLVEEGVEIGFIVIENITKSFQNVSFIESFQNFIISEFKSRKLMEEMTYLNSHDDLTGLLNRTSYENFLQKYDKDVTKTLGVAVADINGLKKINSNIGFQGGDYYIKQLAVMLKGVFCGHYIFRLNGDEFVVIAKGITLEELKTGEKELQEWVGRNGNFTISVGYAWDKVETDINELVEKATQTMKVNKKRYYDTEEFTVDVNRRIILKELLSDIQNNEYLIYLQPKIDFDTGKIMGAEALIRHMHKIHGLQMPSSFIGLLEEHNFIRYIDLFVFEGVCKLIKNWQEAGKRIPVISLNFSRLTLLEHDIVSSVEAIYSKYKIPKKYLEIEITESLADSGKNIMYQVVKDFYDAGYSIALDDFGTKYSNLSIMADVNFDMLKIDRSLVNSIAQHHKNRIILKNVILMCSDLNINVIAEGIETEDQEYILKELGCSLGQGYLYGKPMPIEEFASKYLEDEVIV